MYDNTSEARRVALLQSQLENDDLPMHSVSATGSEESFVRFFEWLQYC